MITFIPDNKDSRNSLIPLSNDFSTSSTCAALVGDSKTTSFPSFVHIPSLNYPQSLLISRDEVFKEIKYFREDNHISSLHLFHGNVDLPPASYHASLEELFDGKEDPEESETMMTVFPPSYHQYLVESSKVEAEKCPPHHACDHNIKLKGSSTLYQTKSQRHSGPRFQRI
ncbi:hypothetical protein O181_032522 [Austropuccinia psidii MF-1]|uniref:Uncharacterized protein n=1 Tax=Austropuccinia psidii MF-1 TaxID=1389203 RepID=A0A9Q3H6B6_9BASI|nr:hypothetical protein [Austropuccinia psidii MF-1]